MSDTSGDTQQPDNDNETIQLQETDPVQTQHSVRVGDSVLNYTATTGMMPYKNETGDIEAEFFFVAYTLDDRPDPAERPLTFVFNGGPGSSSVWLHLGALGPRRVKMQDKGWMPAPPYQLEDNAHSWLDLTDLVFIDPVGTGYSRAADPEKNKDYWKINEDIETVGEFIRLYLSRYQRWSSPLFLAGESYGTTRAAGLAGHLVDKGIALNGVALISTVLNFQTLRFTQGNDLPYRLHLPTYTATAWYHGRLSDDLQARDLPDVLAEVEAWADTEYAQILAHGDRLDADTRQTAIETLAGYTGLSETFIDHASLRIHIMHFCKELLRDKKRTVGRLDSRFTGMDKSPLGEMFDHDPSLSAIRPPYTAMMNDYVRRALGYETDREYEILSSAVNQNWEYDRGEFPDTSEDLQSALVKNPFMHVFVGRGYYDLATPHYATDFTLNHMSLDPELRENLHIFDYEAGHMMYLDTVSLEKLKTDFATFLDAALNT
jgi:carboxypeptidase C (cathepsin A)